MDEEGSEGVDSIPFSRKAKTSEGHPQHRKEHRKPKAEV